MRRFIPPSLPLIKKHTGGRSARKSVAVMLPNGHQYSLRDYLGDNTLTSIDECENPLFARSGTLRLFNQSCDFRVRGWIKWNTLPIIVATMP
jgi:hypothetical protein